MFKVCLHFLHICTFFSLQSFSERKKEPERQKTWKLLIKKKIRNFGALEQSLVYSKICFDLIIHIMIGTSTFLAVVLYRENRRSFTR